LVVTQTQRVHREIQELLMQLRTMKPAGPNIKPVRATVTADGPDGWDLHEISNLVMRVTAHWWANIDGDGGIIEHHQPTMSLVVRQTGDAHRDIYRLLTLLRRGAWAKVFGVPNDAGGIAVPLPFALHPMLAVPAEQRLQPDPGEIDLLAARTMPKPARCEWSFADESRKQSAFTVTQSSDAWQLDTDSYSMMSNKQSASARFPATRICQTGHSPETLMQHLDQRLPWLPHRSNAELARLFQITKMASESGDPDTCFHLSIPEVQGTHLHVGFDSKTGRLEKWEAIVDDQLSWRLEFKDADQTTGEWKTIIRTDGKQREIELWQLTSTQSVEDRQFVGPADPETVPSGYLTEDTRNKDSVLRQCQRLVLGGKWKQLTRLLNAELQRHPGHPALLYCLAVCYQFSPDESGISRDRAIDALNTVAMTAERQLVQWITPAYFTFLTKNEIFAIRFRQPLKTRTADDTRQLAAFALNVNQPEQALKLLTAAKVDAPLVQLQALASVRLSDAVRAAKRIATDPSQTATGIISIADELLKKDEASVAETLLATLLQRGDLSPADRLRALNRYAQRQTKMDRWKTCVAAADLHIEMKREADISRILLEVTDSEDVETLIVAAKREKVRLLLKKHQLDCLLSQAESPGNAQTIAELARELFINKRNTGYNTIRVVESMNKSKNPGWTVDLLTSKIKDDEWMSNDLLGRLANAFEARGQTQQAARAVSEQLRSRKRKPQPPSPRRSRRRVRGGGFGFFNVPGR
ncbi:hypothetical protein OAH18_03750, partial [bacterium]|nr:hypothetical protein [bacterium]